MNNHSLNEHFDFNPKNRKLCEKDLAIHHQKDTPLLLSEIDLTLFSDCDHREANPEIGQP